MDNMVLHYEKFHRNELSGRNGNDILLCNEEVQFGDMDEDQIKNNVGDNVQKIKCKQVCKCSSTL